MHQKQDLAVRGSLTPHWIRPKVSLTKGLFKISETFGRVVGGVTNPSVGARPAPSASRRCEAMM